MGLVDSVGEKWKYLRDKEDLEINWGGERESGVKNGPEFHFVLLNRCFHLLTWKTAEKSQGGMMKIRGVISQRLPRTVPKVHC